MRPRSSLRLWVRRWYLPASLLSVWLILSLGSALVEGWSVLDGLYYGIASLTTVGFGDLVPTRPATKLLAICLIPVGIVLVFGIGLLLIQEALRSFLTRRVHRMVQPGLSDHYLVCGFGKIGRAVVRSLQEREKPVCVVEKDISYEGELLASGLDYVIGDALDTRILLDAGLERARCVVTTFDNDANNVYVVLEVRDLCRDLTVIATASSAEAARRLKLAGTNRVVSPSALAGEMLARTAQNPEALDFVTEITGVSGPTSSFGQVCVDSQSWLVGRSLAEVGRLAPGALIMMAKSGSQVALAPGGQMIVEDGMILAVLGDSEAIKAMTALEAPSAS